MSPRINKIVLSIFFLLVLVLLLRYVAEPNIYPKSLIDEQELEIFTKNVRSWLYIEIKPSSIFSEGTKYIMDFNHPRIVDNSEYYIAVYPGTKVKNISKIDCKYFFDEETFENCEYKWHGDDETTGRPIIISIKENLKAIRLEFECSTCSYAGILLNLTSANVYHIRVNFNASPNNIIDGIKPIQVGDFITPELIERHADNILFRVDDERITVALIPIYLIMRNRAFEALNILIISIIGGLVLVLFSSIFENDKLTKEIKAELTKSKSLSEQILTKLDKQEEKLAQIHKEFKSKKSKNKL